MQIPPFLPEHTLSEWLDCTLEIACGCGRTSCQPVRLLRERHGDLTFSRLATKLRCSACRGRPGPVYVVAGRHREATGGGPPDWAVILIRERSKQPG